MYKLVEVRKDDIFTNSKVIAEGTNNKHHAIQQFISKFVMKFVMNIKNAVKSIIIEVFLTGSSPVTRSNEL